MRKIPVRLHNAESGHKHISRSSSYYYKHRGLKVLLRTIIVIGAIVILAISGFAYNQYRNLERADTISRQNAEKKLEELQSTKIQMLTAQLDPKINEIIASYPHLQISVACIDINSGKLLHYGLNEPFIAASTSKLLSAIFYLVLVEKGQLGLEESINGQTAEYQIQQMIEKSDNTAWKAINDLLDRNRLKDYAHSIGLNSYDPEQNTITADEVATLLEKLYKRHLLKEEHTQLLFGFMRRADQDVNFTAVLPPNVEVLHKSGWLEDRFHDAAIINNGYRPYVLVIFSKASGPYDPEQGRQLFQRTTNASVEVFFQN